MIFVPCENCGKKKLWFRIKKQRIYVKQIGEIVEGRKKICKKCKKVVESALKERNA
jgi:hypothetical protein